MTHHDPDDELSIPQDVDAERALLATIIMNPGHPEVPEVLQAVQPVHFMDPRHRAIFESFTVLASAGVGIDALSIKAEMERAGTLGKVGGPAWIFDLCASLDVDHPLPLATRIRELWARRMIMRESSRILRESADTSIPASELLESLSRVTETVTTDLKASSGKSTLIDLLLTGPELASMKVPPREMIVAPFIATGSLNLVVAPRGLGKTFFGMELCKAVTTGTAFFEWHVPVPRDVLFLDGEMPTEMLQERFAFLYQGSISDRLFILPSEALWTKDKPLNLNEPESQQRVQALLDALDTQGRKPPLIIMDNLSSLSFGVDENDNTMQDSILRWLMGLRHQGYSVLLVHHTGKNGEQRGASRREDFLDTSIRLSKPDGGAQGEGAAFKIEFTKERGRKASPNTLTVALEEGPHGEPIWTQPKTMPEYMRALLTIYQHHPDNYTALGKLLDISRQAAQKHVEKLREKGFVHPLKMALTSKGNKAIPELNQMVAA